MDWSLPLSWLLSTLIGAGACYVVIREKLADHESRIIALEREIGTRDSGMRKAIHDQQHSLINLDGRVRVLEHRDE